MATAGYKSGYNYRMHHQPFSRCSGAFAGMATVFLYPLLQSFSGKSVVRKGLQDQISQEKPPAGYSFFVSTRCCRQGPTRPCSRGGYTGYGGYGPVL